MSKKQEVETEIIAIEFYRQVHIDWIRFLAINNNFDDSLVGDISYHQTLINSYDDDLDILREFLLQC